jgi:gamma-tubulin complex component 5
MDDDDLDDTVSSVGSDFAYGLSPRPLVQSTPLDSTSPGQGREKRTYEHRKDVEQMLARQYWRPEWRTDVSLTRPFDLGDASTLG